MSRVTNDPVHTEASDHPEGSQEGATKRRRPWRFADVESLWDALERYHHYHESCRVRSLWVGDGGGGAVGIEMTDQWAMFMEANRSIDRAMARMRLMDPKVHLLLHHYYRRGLCEQAAGWIEAAAKAGFTVSSKEPHSRKAFDWSLEQAVVLLWGLHRMPARAWSMVYRTIAPPEES